MSNKEPVTIDADTQELQSEDNTSLSLLDKEQPDQLSLLNVVDNWDIENPEDYVHIIELWDLLPMFDDRANVYSNSLSDLTTRSTIRPSHYEIVVKRGATEVKDGEKERFKRAGVREKKVLDTIKYMAAQSYGTIQTTNDQDLVSGKVTPIHSISVSAYSDQIRKLAKAKLGYSISGGDVKEALEVLSESPMTIQITNTKTGIVRTISRPILTKVSDGKGTMHKLELHPLHSRSIIENPQFQLQNHKYLGYNPVAQAIINRIHLNFTQASGDNYYHVLLSTLYNETLHEDWPMFKGPDKVEMEVDGKMVSKSIREPMWRKVQRAIKELEKSGAIKDFKYENKTHVYGGNKEYWHDKLLKFYMSDTYVKDRIAATVATRKIRNLDPRTPLKTAIDHVLLELTEK